MERYSLFFFFILTTSIFSQSDFLTPRINSDFQFDSYYYLPDSLIDAQEVKEKILYNGYFFTNITLGNFDIELRYESYRNPILGYDRRWEGSGLAYRKLSFRNSFISLSAGNFYEQFGSGIIFRSYEERSLGIDNSIDGLKIEITPTDGITFKSIFGKQRNFWNLSRSILRGGDVNFELSNLFPNFFENSALNVGFSVVSRYQADLDPKYKLPENVLAFASRIEYTLPNFTLFCEYAHKINDPTFRNKFTYNEGNGANLNLTYFTEGFSYSLNLHRYDNIEFRTEREAKGLELLINYLPPLTKQYHYSLPAFYPHSTQGNGEVGLYNEIIFSIPAKTFLGGEYGSTITVGYSRIHSLDTTHKDEFTYSSPFFGVGKELFYEDIYFDYRSKIIKDLELELSLIKITYNKDVMENEGSPLFGKVNSFTIASEAVYQISRTNAIRFSFQHLWSKNDSTVAADDRKNGNWVAGLIEYTIAPSWFFSLANQWNYGNANEELRLHYPKFAITYIQKTTRLSLAFGKEPGGIVCVGGVCRLVPSSYGFSFSITSSF